jgi:hypothetical protein
VTAADRAGRERQRLRDAADRVQRKRAHALAQAARTRQRLADLDAEMAAAALAELDEAETTETGGAA